MTRWYYLGVVLNSVQDPYCKSGSENLWTPNRVQGDEIILSRDLDAEHVLGERRVRIRDLDPDR